MEERKDTLSRFRDKIMEPLPAYIPGAKTYFICCRSVDNSQHAQLKTAFQALTKGEFVCFGL